MKRMKTLVEESRSKIKKGVSYRQQVMAGYIEQILNLKIMSVEKPEETLKFIAYSEKRNLHYIFEEEMYCPDNVDRGILALLEIYNDEESYETNTAFYMSSTNGGNHYLLQTPLENLKDKSSVVQKNFIKAFQTTKELLLSEHQDREVSQDFKLLQLFSGNREVAVSRGYSNSIIFRFLHDDNEQKSPAYESTHISFTVGEFARSEGSLVAGINKVNRFIHQFLDDKVLLSGKHNVSELFDKLQFHKVIMSSDVFIEGDPRNPLYNSEEVMTGSQLTHKFNIEDSLHDGDIGPVKVNLDYNFASKTFGVNAEFLSRSFSLRCSKVSQVLLVIESLESLMNGDSKMFEKKLAQCYLL